MSQATTTSVSRRAAPRSVASAWTENTGMYRGDGMFDKPVYDPFWDRLGLAPNEVGIEALPGDPYGQVKGPVIMTAPNPFNPVVVIRVANDGRRGGIQIENAGNMENAAPPMQLVIYDMSGRSVIKSVIRSPKSAITWNASAHPSGLYLVRLRVGNRAAEKKITLLK